jgi:hypothetical protein
VFVEVGIVGVFVEETFGNISTPPLSPVANIILSNPVV